MSLSLARLATATAPEGGRSRLHLVQAPGGLGLAEQQLFPGHCRRGHMGQGGASRGCGLSVPQVRAVGASAAGSGHADPPAVGGRKTFLLLPQKPSYLATVTPAMPPPVWNPTKNLDSLRKGKTLNSSKGCPIVSPHCPHSQHRPAWLVPWPRNRGVILDTNFLSHRASTPPPALASPWLLATPAFSCSQRESWGSTKSHSDRLMALGSWSHICECDGEVDTQVPGSEPSTTWMELSSVRLSGLLPLHSSFSCTLHRFPWRTRRLHHTRTTVSSVSSSTGSHLASVGILSAETVPFPLNLSLLGTGPVPADASADTC
ncbi:uncharacterized protein LOC123644611 [Lemur catta]|uniref:uncharacterized protein LOC123644611 n=1 Tax=Lemur catta TaxID=9447 RepID=UPI001E269AB2|nr:uncharacterized protein LOC123644611 [Lemur catta]XP_045416784.1 uncharacterized protein LOC123644611 [Lemur catta]XP_045416790.1 uncharacterized protein LOC123644611 [Lemur catta]XP_045416797.1 uncharacterized protein LOC123644611 [Lemur catta]XP_045416803.1 uncharacterized protein LOC123644611 [Lemur catta]XP_045416811.1 uncharacterized protein LOC123644611 [Lemur catta]XP_045416820.1 uncharacterized protein LOC123644611 [Lemur catta]XP_045416827.1 uncharacterized protein LOC123644611 [